MRYIPPSPEPSPPPPVVGAGSPSPPAPPSAAPADPWFDRTIQVHHLGDPEIPRPEKPWHPRVYAGVKDFRGEPEDGPRMPPRANRGP